MIKRFLKIVAPVGAAAVALLLVAGLSTVGTALAGTSTPTPAPTATATATPDPLVQDTVNTNAVVGGVGVAPIIECKWELPDMQVGVTDSTYPDGRIQYSIASDAHVHDDDMAVSPSTSPACDVPMSSGVAVGDPTQPNDVTHMIQVVPVPQDIPEQRHIQLWMAVSDDNGISAIADVFWKVWESVMPNGKCLDGTTPVPGRELGCLKVQVHGTPVPQANCDPNNAQSLGDSSATRKMFEAAVHTGQVSAAAVNDTNYGMLNLCAESEKEIYYNSFDLSKEQPCGMYQIDATAVGLGGPTTTLTNFIDVECVFYLKIDFNKVDWAGISPGYRDVVSGDLVWNSPPDNAPTIMNVGNDGMGLGLIYSPMVGANFGKLITTFDACFGVDAAHLQCIGNDSGQPGTWIQANVLTQFDNDPSRVLCADKMGKLDLSIHPPATLPADTYTGTLTVIGRHVPSICNVGDNE